MGCIKGSQERGGVAGGGAVRALQFRGRILDRGWGSVLLGSESKPRKSGGEWVEKEDKELPQSKQGLYEEEVYGVTPNSRNGLGESPHQAPVGHHQHDIHPRQPVTAGRHGLPTPRRTAPVYPAALPRQPGLFRGKGALVPRSSPAISLRGKTKADPARKHGGLGSSGKKERHLPAFAQHVT